MSLNEKIKKLFADFKIGIPDIPEHQYHLYADYVELIALVADSQVTRADILDRLLDEGVDFSEEEDVENSFSIEAEKNEENRDNDELFSEQAERNDKYENRINQIFEVIKYRHFLFSSDYPFEFDNNGLILKNDLSDSNKIYLSLLIASNLNYFKPVQSELTSEFEEISYRSLENFMPKNAVVKQMGKNGCYSGNAKKKIKQLSADMNIDLNDKEVSNIADRNNQERGLDLISWIPFKDNIPNFLTILGQCACGKDWHKKQNETGRYENYLNFYKQGPIHALFIPYSLSNDGSFFQSDDITKDRIIFDRKRIIDFLPAFDFFAGLQSKEIVNKCIEHIEDMV